MLRLYSRLLYLYPGTILFVTGFISVGLTLIGLFTTDLPDFSDPRLGFSTSDTGISNRIDAFQLLQDEASKLDGVIGIYPPETERRTRRSIGQASDDADKDFYSASARVHMRRPTFCPSERFTAGHTRAENLLQLVFELGDVGSPRAAAALCDVERRLWTAGLLTRYDDCLTPRRASRQRASPPRCCQPWHLGSLLAHRLGNASCADAAAHWPPLYDRLLRCAANKSDVQRRWRLAQRGKASAASGGDGVSIMEEACPVDFHLFYHYFLPMDFPTSSGKANLTVMLLPLVKTAALSYDGPLTTGFVESMARRLSADGARLVAMDLGLKQHLFDEYLLRDSAFGYVAAALVLACMWLQTGSLLYTLAALSGIGLSAGVAYFVYRVVLGIHFFPFINLLTLVLLIGVGADDAFVLRRAWTQAKASPDASPPPAVMHAALRHAALSMLVTSLTTAAAFFATAVSHVVAIRCFGLFAGTAMLANYALVVSWLPAALMLLEKRNCAPLAAPLGAKLPRLRRLLLCDEPRRLLALMAEACRVLFEKILPWLVIRLRLVWTLVFGVAALGAAVVVLHRPGVRLPERDHLQLFGAAHPFERFDTDVRPRFAYLRRPDEPVAVRVVWGVEPDAPANALDPLSKGALRPWAPAEFRLADNVNLLWLRDLCANLSAAAFTRPLPRHLRLPACFVDDFMIDMRQDCVEPMDGSSRSPCCAEKPFPFERDVFDTCLRRFTTANLGSFFGAGLGSLFQSGPLFRQRSDGNGTVFGGLVITFPSVYNFSLSYAAMDDFYAEASEWVAERLASGPEAVRGGWFVSEHLAFYDLQRALVDGTRLAVLIALPLAYAVLLAVTRNLVVSLLAVVTISSVVLVTVGSLVLLGWRLNVLESTIVILTVGLSFDFTLHYAVAFALSAEKEAAARVSDAVGRVAAAIFMSFATTFVAGAAMTPATTLAYFQIGLFMMLVTLVSWLYSTFFFCAALYSCAPAERLCGWRASAERGGGGGELGGALEPMMAAAGVRRTSSSLGHNRTAFGVQRARRASLPAVAAVGPVAAGAMDGSNNYRRRVSEMAVIRLGDVDGVAHRADSVVRSLQSDFGSLADEKL